MEGDHRQKAMITLAQQGDDETRNSLINQHLPLIRQAVRHYVHQPDIDHLDEYSIAMLAFDQALSQYRTSSLLDFEHYARLLIKNRLIDWSRSQKRHEGQLSLSQSENNSFNDEKTPLQDRLISRKTSQIQVNVEFQESLLILQQQLEYFQIDFSKLSRKLPRHKDRRMMCLHLARLIDQNIELNQKLWKTKRLPVSDLVGISEIKQKTIEKNRAAIIFYTLLIQSDMDMMKNYLKQYERRNQDE